MTLIKAIRAVLLQGVIDGSGNVGAGGSSASGSGATSGVGSAGVGAAGSGNTGAAENGGAGAGAGNGVNAGQGEGGAVGATDGSASQNGGSGSADNASQAAGDGTQNGAAQPVTYGAFVVPDGITLNPELLTEFTGIAQGYGLQQEQAQALTDLGVKLTQQVSAQYEAALGEQSKGWLDAFNPAVDLKDFKQPAALTEMSKSWEAIIKADPALGGEKLGETLAVARLARENYFSKDFMQVLDRTGFGNHPEFIKAFHKIGLTLKADGVVTGDANTGQPKDAAKVFFPSMN